MSLRRNAVSADPAPHRNPTLREVAVNQLMGQVWSRDILYDILYGGMAVLYDIPYGAEWVFLCSSCSVFRKAMYAAFGTVSTAPWLDKDRPIKALSFATAKIFLTSASL